MIAAAAIGFALASAGSVVLVSTQTGRAEFVAAVGDGNALRARVTGGFLPPARLGPDRSRSTGNYRLLAAAARTLDRARSGDAEATRDLGVAHLLLGNVDQGIATLEYERIERPEDPRVHADLSAGYIERAEREEEPEDFARAYDAACRALELEPGLTEALFNRAVALEGMGLTWVSPLAWNEFLGREANPQWRSTADRRLVETLKSETARQIRDRAREAFRMNLAQASVRDVVQHLKQFPELAHDIASLRLLPDVARWRLGEWNAGVLSPNEADEILRAIARLRVGPGEAIAARSIMLGDPNLARAQIEFARIRALLDEWRFAEAARALQAIEPVFRSAASPYELWVAFHRAVIDFQIGNPAGSTARFPEIERRARGLDRELGARALWMRSLVGTGRGLLEAWKAQRLSEAIFDELGNRQRVAELAGRQAVTLTMMGDTRSAWKYRVTALQGLTLAAPPRTRYASLTATVVDLQETGLRPAARDLAHLSIPTADAAGALEAVDIRKELVRDETPGRPLDGSVLAAAAAALDRISDPDLRRQLAGELILAETVGLLRRGEAPVALAQRAVNAFQESRSGVLGSQALVALGRALKHAGRPGEGRMATARAFAELRDRQTDQSSGKVPLEAQEGLEESGADLVGALVSEGKAIAALDVVRSIEGAVPPAVPTRTDRLILILFGREEGTEAWVRAGGVTRHRTLDLDGPTRRAIAARYRLLLQLGRPDEATHLLQSKLYPRLIGPLAPWIFSGEADVVIVPPRELHGIPFGLLRSDAAAPRVLDRVTLWYASSVSRAFEGSLAPAKLTTALVVGDPSFADEDASLARLPESRKEAEEAAAAHPGAVLLTGAAASRERVIQALNGQSVVHFATHGIANSVRPGLSYLVLGGVAGQRGRLYAVDPVWSKFRGTRLVVLSACHGTAERAATSGAALGLVRAITDAGVENVIASTNRTADQAARVLMRHLHKGLAEGLSSGEALRRAQQQAIRELGPEAERDIGAFRVFV